MAGVCVHEGYRCDACQAGQCYDGPTYHVWYNKEDEKWFEEKGMELPTGPESECGCYYCGRPAIARQKLDSQDEVSNNQPGT